MYKKLSKEIFNTVTNKKKSRKAFKEKNNREKATNSKMALNKTLESRVKMYSFFETILLGSHAIKM